MQKVESHREAYQRLLSISYVILASVALSVVLALAAYCIEARRGTQEISKLRVEMAEIKHQMADRSDLQAVRKSLLQLERDVQKVSDNVQRHR